MYRPIAFLLIFLATTAAAAPEIQVFRGPIVSHASSVDARDIPPDYFYLSEHANRLHSGNSAEYFSRWERFAKESSDCPEAKKLQWFLSFSRNSVRIPAIEQKNAEFIEALVIQNPGCFLRAYQSMHFGAISGLLLDHYLFSPKNHSVEQLDAALRKVLDEPEFHAAAQDYERHHRQYRERVAREQAEKERLHALEMKRYWMALQGPDLYLQSPTEYWNRWQSLVEKASACDNPEMLTYLLEAAASNVTVDEIRTRSAPIIEALTLSKPSCVLDGMQGVRELSALISAYLLEPSGDTPEALHEALSRVRDDGSAARQTYEREYARYLYRIADPVTDPREPLWSVKLYDSYWAGTVFVQATYIKDYSEFQDELKALWQQDEASGLVDWRGQPIKVLPRHALDFMTLGQFGTYYLLRIDRAGLQAVKARVVASALARWDCEGEIVSLLVLKPEQKAEWLAQTGEYPVSGGAIELRNDLEIPELIKLDWDNERPIHRGRLVWPSTQQSVDFSYTDAAFGINFELTDNGNGKKHYALEASASCH